MFEITLRKATKVRSKLESAIKNLKNVEKTITVNLHDTNVEQSISARREKLVAGLAEFFALSDALANIRAAIGVTNAAQGVSARLSFIAAEEAKIAALKVLLSDYIGTVTEPVTDEQIASRIAGVRAQMSNEKYRGGSNQEFVLITPSMVSDIEANIKKIRTSVEQLHEEIEAINNTAKISLSDDVVAFLQSKEIL